MAAPPEPAVNCCGLARVKTKYIALLLLVAQTVGAIITLRISRLSTDNDGRKYISTTAVLLSEILKGLCSVGLVIHDNNFAISKSLGQIFSAVIADPWETFKVGVPAILYTLQNNLLFIALSNISPALYQITYQLKILTTAILSVIMLRRKLSASRWISLLILTVGVGLVQVPTKADDGGAHDRVTMEDAPWKEGSTAIGVTAVLCACFTSGFAGVYFEKILKTSKLSIWMRNIQLALLGTVVSFIAVWWNDYPAVQKNGFFQGYNHTVWLAIFLQSAGGLIVAAVLKYADNILKCFGNAVAIILSCLCSYLLIGDFVPTKFFFVGALFVIFATYTYGTDTKLTSSTFLRICGLSVSSDGLLKRDSSGGDEDEDVSDDRGSLLISRRQQQQQQQKQQKQSKGGDSSTAAAEVWSEGAAEPRDIEMGVPTSVD